MSLLITLVVCVIVLIFAMCKNSNTYKNRQIILNAIFVYQMKCIWNHEEGVVEYSDMSHYDKTFYRIWDWGYTRILPKEKFEVIKPYIGLPTCFCNIVTPSDIAENGCDDCEHKAQCIKFLKG